MKFELCLNHDPHGQGGTIVAFTYEYIGNIFHNLFLNNHKIVI